MAAPLFVGRCVQVGGSLTRICADGRGSFFGSRIAVSAFLGFAGACCGAFPGGLLAWWVAPPRRQWFEEVVWGAVGRVSATWMSPKSPHGRVHGVPDEGPPHRLHRRSPPQRPRARHSTDTSNLARSAGTPQSRCE